MREPAFRLEASSVTIDGRRLVLSKFPEYVEHHLRRVPRTRETEALAHDLITQGFACRDIESFVKAVCKWGGYPGIWGRVLHNNGLSQLARTFRVATQALDNQASLEIAIRRVLSVHGLGVSFASKHLRFLSPQRCAILGACRRKSGDTHVRT